MGTNKNIKVTQTLAVLSNMARLLVLYQFQKSKQLILIGVKPSPLTTIQAIIRAKSKGTSPTTPK